MTFEGLNQPVDVVALAARLPQLSPDDPRLARPRIGLTQFRNNFFVLFLALSKGDDVNPSLKSAYINPAFSDPETAEYIRSGAVEPVVEFFRGEEWLNLELVTETRQLEANKELWPDIYGAPSPGLRESIEVAAGGIRGLTSATVYVWDKLNPLLEQTFMAMEAAGLSIKSM